MERSKCFTLHTKQPPSTTFQIISIYIHPLQNSFSINSITTPNSSIKRGCWRNVSRSTCCYNIHFHTTRWAWAFGVTGNCDWGWKKFPFEWLISRTRRVCRIKPIQLWIQCWVPHTSLNDSICDETASPRHHQRTKIRWEIVADAFVTCTLGNWPTYPDWLKWIFFPINFDVPPPELLREDHQFYTSSIAMQTTNRVVLSITHREAAKEGTWIIDFDSLQWNLQQ